VISVGNLNQVGIGVLVTIFVVGRFLFRELRERRYAIGRIYLLPAIVGAIALALVAMSWAAEPGARALLAPSCLAGLALGGAIGYGVAHFTTVRVTADPKVLYSRGSYATVAIWIVAFALRFLARVGASGGNLTRPSPDALAFNAALVLLLASALFFVRYRLLVAAKSERARGIATAISAI
jgi:hypothetical protein